MSEEGFQSPLDMLSSTDVHALRRVRRMCTRVLAEAENHRGHDSPCPFADPRMIDSVKFLLNECEGLAQAYENRHGEVPHYPITTMMSRREGAPPEA